MGAEFVTWKEFREWHKVEERQVFFTHLIAYIVFNLYFIYLNMTRTPDLIWFIYPLGAWGCGVALHYISAVGMFDYLYAKREEQVQRNLVAK